MFLRILCGVLCTMSTLSISHSKAYALSVGTKDENRLEILNEVYNPCTFSLLNRSIQPGMSVLDVGCGTGIVSCEIAKIVGPLGKVTCVDISQDHLNIAKHRAEKEGLSNMEFVCLSAYEIHKMEKHFDALYCRFLLIHLKDPMKVIDQFLAHVHPQGLLILEEAIGIKNMDSYPEEQNALKAYCKMVEKQMQIQDSDFSTGKFLAGILQNKKCTLHYENVMHPILKTPREKSLLRLGIRSLLPQLEEPLDIQEAKEIMELLHHLEAKNVDIPYFEVMQIIAQKPT